MTDRNINHLHPLLQPLCREFLAQCRAHHVLVMAQAWVFITETYRNEYDQNADYAKGRTMPGHIITNARYGESPHNCTLTDGVTPAAQAFDFAIEVANNGLDWDAGDVLWQHTIQIGTDLGLVSGSKFQRRDSCHMELANWKNLT